MVLSNSKLSKGVLSPISANTSLPQSLLELEVNKFSSLHSAIENLMYALNESSDLASKTEISCD